MKKKIIIGNWKMNPRSVKEAEKWYKDINKALSKIKNTEVAIAAPYIYLANLKKLSKKVLLGAQDLYMGDVGPFTGEVSADMLYNLGVRFSIVGHSERRAMGETNAFINQKVKAAIFSGITPILCVGESERDVNHEYLDVVSTQVEECLKGINKNSFSKIIIAYEPVWAISSTPNSRIAMPEDSNEMAIYIRKIIAGISSLEIAKHVRILYGGSVSERDASDFLEHGGVDGALVGRASLDPKKFIQIIQTCETLNK